MSDIVFGCFAFGAVLVRFFFNVGFLTPYWIEIRETNATNMVSNTTNSSTPSPTARTCHHGLFYSLNCSESENVLDSTTLVLNIAASLCLTILPVILGCISGLLCNEKKENEDRSCANACSSLYLFFYALGGLFGLISTVYVCAKYDNSLLGWSFFYTVAAAFVILLQVVLLLTYCIFSRNAIEKLTCFMDYRRKDNYEKLKNE
eukprot:XP_019921214.1 PREDICTED: uncharacterized protein LOC109618284 [Crassostrea gigas]